MKRILMVICAMMSIISCNHFPPVSGECMDEINRIVPNVIQTVTSIVGEQRIKNKSVEIYVVPGNISHTINIYGIVEYDERDKVEVRLRADKPGWNLSRKVII